jgi:hypothetical protein
MAGLEDRSRQPLHSPNKTAPEIEDYVIAKRRLPIQYGDP